MQFKKKKVIILVIIQAKVSHTHLPNLSNVIRCFLFTLLHFYFASYLQGLNSFEISSQALTHCGVHFFKYLWYLTFYSVGNDNDTHRHASSCQRLALALQHTPCWFMPVQILVVQSCVQHTNFQVTVCFSEFLVIKRITLWYWILCKIW